MARSVRGDSDAVVARLTGWTALAASDLSLVRRRGKVLRLELQRTVPGAGYDVVAVGVDDLDAVAAEIGARARRVVSQWKRTVSGAMRRITRSDVIAASS